jgi:bis(5'-nucleosyl)-tetraphosphatase (symmetrical)
MILLVGDIQGCDAALERLLAVAGFSASRDRLVVLGDLVNRGPASLAVLQRLRALEGSASCLLGNHDLHLLAVAHGARPAHHGDTLDDILHGRERDASIAWLRAQRMALHEAGWLCVHAGVPPNWSAADTLARAAEIETLLRSADLAAFLPLMYGNEPARWDDGLQGPPRWRFIVNALTRMRFCTDDGTLDLKTKEGAHAAPAGFQPWFDIAGRKSAATPIAFGHWSTLGLIDRPDLLALDTGCVWGGRLSAARVDGGRREILQVECPQARHPG